MTTCAVTGCGTGGWTGPLPGDPDNVVTLSAVPVFGGVEVSWTYPTTNPWAVAHTLLFRSASSAFSSATQLSVVSGSKALDQTGPAPGGGPWYYWIQIVSINGTQGSVIGPASATPVTLVSQLIEQLTGQIDSGVLANALKTRIDKITLNEQAIVDEVNARIAANTAYQTMLSQLQAGVANALTLVQTEVTQRTNGDSALATQLNTVATANANNASLIQVETQARVDADSALAAQYTTLNSQVNNPTTGLPATRASLANDYYTKTQTDSAISSATLTLASTTQLNAALANYTTTAALQQNYLAKTDVNSAVSGATFTAQTGFGSTLTSVQQTLQAHINTAGNRIQNIGGRYTVVIDANGQVGGFGIYNDGTTVEAGFDVDKFWVGKTNSNRRKPFIISGGVVYIDNAMINQLTADKIDTRGLTIRDASNNIIFGSGTGIGGGNRVVNSDLFQSADYWAITWNQNGGSNYTLARNLAGASWIPIGGNQIGLTRSGNALTGVIDFGNTQSYPVEVGKRYEFSAYLAAHRCDNDAFVVFINSGGGQIAEVHGTVGRANGGQSLSNWRRSFGFAVAPAGATHAQIRVRTTAVDAGQSDGYSWGTMFSFKEATVSQTEPSLWTAGPNGFYGTLNADRTSWDQAFANSGGAMNGATYIAAASIDTLRVGGNQITIVDSKTGAYSAAASGIGNTNNQIDGPYTDGVNIPHGAQRIILTASILAAAGTGDTTLGVRFYATNNNGGRVYLGEQAATTDGQKTKTHTFTVNYSSGPASPHRVGIEFFNTATNGFFVPVSATITALLTLR